MKLPGLPKLNFRNIDIQRRMPLIIALVLGLIAVVIANSYLKKREAEMSRLAQMQRQGRMEKVIIAKVDIDEGVTIKEDMLALKEIPEKFIQPRAATQNDVQRVLGRKTITLIPKDGQVLLSSLQSIGKVRGGGLAALTPPGKRAITIPVDNISSVGGMVRPQDYVDILGVIPQQMMLGDKEVTQYMTVPLFQKVLVLAVGPFTGAIKASKGDKINLNTITVALPPEEATMVAFVQEQGKLRFILRSPADADTEMPKPAAWNTLFMYLFPELASRMQQVSKEPEREVVPQVEIYRGTEREVAPLLY